MHSNTKELIFLLKFVTENDWNTPKLINSTFYKIRRDLSFTPKNCILYYNRMVIPRSLEQFVKNIVYNKQLGQAGMFALFKLICFPNIHPKLVAEAQNCRHFVETGKNWIPLTSKSNIGNLPELKQPNDEVEMDVAGPLTLRNTICNYILVTVDRLSRYSSAEPFNNCHAKTS